MHCFASELGAVVDAVVVDGAVAGAAGEATSIVTCFESVPPGPLAIRVYVVRLFGSTCLEPFFSTRPPSIETSSARSVCQLNCTDWPGWIDDSLGANKEITGFDLGISLSSAATETCLPDSAVALPDHG